jgi:competence protein ComEC
VGAGIFLFLRIFPNFDISVFNPSAFPTSTPAPIATGDTLQVRILDIGQGDSIFIRTPNGSTMLIDGGEKNSGALDFLEAQGIDRINVMVASHPHADHIGGLVDILRSDIAVDEVVDSGYTSTSRTYEQYLDGIIDRKAKYREVHRGDTITLDGLTFDVLSPGTEDDFDNTNDGSVVLRLVFGPTSFLFTGDAEHEAEEAMLEAGVPLQADILKLGHHGSSTSTTDAFLAAVDPEVAIYSAAEGNSYGHPHRETVAKLKEAGIPMYGTDVSGTVTITADNNGYKLTTAKP